MLRSRFKAEFRDAGELVDRLYRLYKQRVVESGPVSGLQAPSGATGAGTASTASLLASSPAHAAAGKKARANALFAAVKAPLDEPSRSMAASSPTAAAAAAGVVSSSSLQVRSLDPWSNLNSPSSQAPEASSAAGIRFVELTAGMRKPCMCPACGCFISLKLTLSLFLIVLTWPALS